MIKVTVELISSHTGQTTLLGSALIANTGEGTRTRGDYTAVFGLKRKMDWRTSTTTNYPRSRLNVWYLLHRLLGEALK
jgi:hypothetical protein